MDITKFKRCLFEAAREAGFEEFEVFAPSSDSFSVRIFQGEVQEFKNAHSSGVAFRGRIGGRMGYASSEQLSEGAVGFILEKAKENAALLSDEADTEPLYNGNTNYPDVDTYEPELGQVSSAEKCDMARSLEKAVLAADERVVSVDAAVLGTAESRLVIANSLGLDVEQSSSIAFAYVMVRVQEVGGEPKIGMEAWGGRSLKGFSPQALAREAVDKALAQLGAVKPQSGLHRVVFNNETASDLFAAFAPNFYAENVQKGFSLMAGMQGQRIASEKLTIRDDGYLKDCKAPEGEGLGWKLGSNAFDSEGVATRNKAIVAHGRLESFLYNLKAAAREGVEPTGNGVRRGLGGAITTGCGMFYVEPSSTSFDEVVDMAENGILITSLMGLHSGTNVVSGEFSLQASGFLIKDGRVGMPLEQMVVSGNFYSLINDIVEVGNDLDFDIPSSEGTFGAPSILVSSLPIAGA